MNNEELNNEELKNEDLKTNSENFRLSAKKLFLTYSRTELTHLEVLEQLKTKLPEIKLFMVAEEAHEKEKNGVSKHVHAYIESSKKLDIRKADFLDLNDYKLGKKIHGKYETIQGKSKWKILNYLRKGSIYISNMEEEENIKDFYKYLAELTREKGVKYALEYFAEKKPELVVSKFSSLKTNLNAYAEFISKEKLKAKFDNFEFPEEILYWFEKEKNTHTLFLTGRSGWGKTQGMIYLLKEFNPLLVTTKDGLKHLSLENRAIIIDDTNWAKYSRADRLHLCDLNVQGSIEIRYQDVRIPSNVIRVIISNNSTDLIDPLHPDEAILRRIRHVELKKPLFNITNNNDAINNYTDNSRKKEELPEEFEKRIWGSSKETY